MEQFYSGMLSLGEGKNIFTLELAVANGSNDFHSGNWLGYEGENVIATLELKKQQSLQDVGVRFLSHPGSWIFSPKNISFKF